LNITFTGNAGNGSVVLQSTGRRKDFGRQLQHQWRRRNDQHVRGFRGDYSGSQRSGTTSFTNVAAAVDTELSGTGGVSVTYTSTQLTGTSDSLKLRSPGGATGASIDFEAWNGAATGVAETLNITSSTAASFITLNANNDHKTINVSGDQNLSITSVLIRP